MRHLRSFSAALVVFGITVWLLSGLNEQPTVAAPPPVKGGFQAAPPNSPSATTPGANVPDPRIPAGRDPIVIGPDNPGSDFKTVAAIHAKHKMTLIKSKGISGFGIIKDPENKGNFAFRVYTSGNPPPAVPEKIDGVSVYTRYVPRGFEAYQTPLPPVQQRRLPRPVPIGTSISIVLEDSVDAANPLGQCYSGTLGCRVRDSVNDFYGLSNNHVLGLSDKSLLGHRVCQPSSGDSGCLTQLYTNQIGTFLKFVRFDYTAINFQDSAIMRTTPSLVGNGTPDVGYGIPTRTSVDAFIGQRVQKMGRTTGYTKQGEVAALNVIIIVGGYPGGSLVFDNQIEVDTDFGFTAFGGPGDSGSLIVDMNKNPVALLFAGSTFIIFGNPIQYVLDTYQLTIDGDTPINPTVPPANKGGKFKSR